MSGRRALPALDGFRWVAALLVVPFFFMTTGCFMAAYLNDGTWLRRQMNRLAAMYGAAVVAYLPLNAYAGALNRLDFGACQRALLLNGTFYHLWYLPEAMLGLCIAWALLRAGGMKSALAVSDALYALLFCCFSHTRNGLFFAPLFLMLGAAQAGCADCCSRPGAVAGGDVCGGAAPAPPGLDAPRQHVHMSGSGDDLPVFTAAGARCRAATLLAHFGRCWCT